MTNVRANVVVTRSEALSTTSIQVGTPSLEEVSGSEHKSNNIIPVNQARFQTSLLKLRRAALKQPLDLEATGSARSGR